MGDGQGDKVVISSVEKIVAKNIVSMFDLESPNPPVPSVIRHPFPDYHPKGCTPEQIKNLNYTDATKYSHLLNLYKS